MYKYIAKIINGLLNLIKNGVKKSFVLLYYFLKIPYVFVQRLRGIRISFSSKIASGCFFSGNIFIGNSVVVGHGVTMIGTINVGEGSNIEQGVYITGNIQIGKNTGIGSYSTLSTMPEGEVIIGNDVHINTMTVIGATERTEIRDHCIFAPFVQITDAMHEFEDLGIVIKHARLVAKPVIIEENVWLGNGVMVMKGVTIGKGSVIGAKSLVIRSIPPLCIAYGIPAKVKRKRGSRIKKMVNK